MSHVTIKTENACIQEHSKINKIFATVDATNFAKLLDVVGLTANPRSSKINKITSAIRDTLKTSPDEMRFKSKGLLLSTLSCEHRERGRFTLSFEETACEGVLDGGHNLLAIGLFILEEYLGETQKSDYNKVKKWTDFRFLWSQHKDDLSEVLNCFEFEIPIEIIYPTKDYINDFTESVFSISDARNNNSALTTGTKANHRGYYQILQNVLDKKIDSKVEWKDGDSGKTIRRDDVVTMALIPLIALQQAGKLKSNLPTINPISIYSSKGRCVDIFSEIIESYTDNDKVSDELLLSAIKLFKDIPKLYDLIYKNFPVAYNKNSSGFGRISCVKIYDKSKKSGGSYLSKPPLTKYYKNECEAKYPDGFIIPILCGLTTLINIDNTSVTWRHDPIDFIEKNLEEGVKMLVNTIKDNDYNPNVVGKSKGAYDSVELMFKYQLTKSV